MEREFERNRKSERKKEKVIGWRGCGLLGVYVNIVLATELRPMRVFEVLLLSVFDILMILFFINERVINTPK